MINFDAQKRFLQMFLLLVQIVVLCFINVAEAKLTWEECSNKNYELMASRFFIDDL